MRHIFSQVILETFLYIYLIEDVLAHAVSILGEYSRKIKATTKLPLNRVVSVSTNSSGCPSDGKRITKVWVCAPMVMNAPKGDVR